MKAPAVLGPAATRLLSQTAGAHRRQFLVRGLIVLFLLTAVFFGSEAVADCFVEFSGQTRVQALALYGLILLAATALLIVLPALRRSNPLHLALRLEAAQPAFAGSLVTLLNPAGTVDDSVRRALRDHAERAAKSCRLRDALSEQIFRRLHPIAAACLASLLLASLLLGPAFYHSLVRCLFPFAALEADRITKTKIERVQPGAATLLEGESLEVTVRRIPAVEDMEVAYTAFPAYTGLRPRSERAEHVDAPIGTRVAVDVLVNVPLAQIWGTWRDRDSQSGHAGRVQLQHAVRPSADGTTERRWRLPFTVKTSGTWTLELESTDGQVGKPVTIPVVARPDRAPRIAVSIPPQSEQIALRDGTSDGLVAFLVSAADDFGLAAAELVLLVGSEEHHFPLRLPHAGARHAFARIEADLAALASESQGRGTEHFGIGKAEIAYYAWAVDRHQPEAQRAQTRLRTLNVQLGGESLRKENRRTHRRRPARRLKQREQQPAMSAPAGHSTASQAARRELPSRHGPERLSRPDQTERPTPARRPDKETDTKPSEYAVGQGLGLGQDQDQEDKSDSRPQNPDRRRASHTPQTQSGKSSPDRRTTDSAPAAAGRKNARGNAPSTGKEQRTSARPGQRSAQDPFGRDPFRQRPKPRALGQRGGQGRGGGGGARTGDANQGGATATEGPGPRRPRHGGNPTGRETGRTVPTSETVLKDRVDALNVTASEAATSRRPLLPGGAIRTDFGAARDEIANDDELETFAGRTRRNVSEIGEFQEPKPGAAPIRLRDGLRAAIRAKVSPDYRALVAEYFRRLQ